MAPVPCPRGRRLSRHEGRVDTVDVEEAQACPVDAQRLAVGRGRLGEGDHVVHDGFHVADDAQLAAGVVNDVNRTAASEAWSLLSVTNTWNTLLAMTASANSRFQAMSAALPSTHSMSVRARARPSAAASGSSPRSRPLCPHSRARWSSMRVPQPTSRTGGHRSHTTGRSRRSAPKD
jgi:hypothetical protein